MKKNIIFLFLILLISWNLFAKISYKQDKKNDKFLTQLDINLVQTLKIISAFNKMANNIPSRVEGLGKYRRFLMDITIETGKLRTDIKSALKSDSELKNLLIKEMILSIKPDAKLHNKNVTAEEDNYNYHFLDDRQKVYKKNLEQIRKTLMEEERKIIKNGKFTPIYYKLHTENYMLSLLLDFMKLHTYLTKENRQILVDVINSVEKSLK
jgi:peptide subunit release factor RF-3